MGAREHLIVVAARKGLRCACGNPADNYARCACGAVLARCANCGPAWDLRARHCA
jgi:hypothetical protein